MTDPIGYSVYISDRDRERLERERRSQQKTVATNGPTPNPSTTAPANLSTTTSRTKFPQLIGISTKLASLLAEEVDQASESDDEVLDEEEIERRLVAAPAPVVTVSNINTEEISWKDKMMQAMALKSLSICDKCKNCPMYQSSAKGQCLECGCDLIFHLKDGEHEPSEDGEDDDEEEWEDDDDDNNGDDFHSDNSVVATSSSFVNNEDPEEEGEGYDEDFAEGGED